MKKFDLELKMEELEDKLEEKLEKMEEKIRKKVKKLKFGKTSNYKVDPSVQTNIH